MDRIEEIVCEISVCSDCMYEHANGEIAHDRPADLPKPWALLEFGYTVSMGGEHNDTCTDADREAGCDCDDLGFRTSPCDGCGDDHHGDRYRFTLWRYTMTYASNRARHHIGAARQEKPRRLDKHSTRNVNLRFAGQWRAYLAARYREEREHAAWMARMAERAA